MVIKCNWFWQHFLRQFGNLPIQGPGMVREKTKLGQGWSKVRVRVMVRVIVRVCPNLTPTSFLSGTYQDLAPALPQPCLFLDLVPTLPSFFPRPCPSPQTCMFPFLLLSFAILSFTQVIVGVL